MRDYRVRTYTRTIKKERDIKGIGKAKNKKSESKTLSQIEEYIARIKNASRSSIKNFRRLREIEFLEFVQ